MSSLTWKFPDQASGLTDYHSIPTDEALDSELETFVREVLQNANDQGRPNGDPVRVTFDFNHLTEDLDTFLDALQWGDERDGPESLRWHVQRAIENDQARDPGLKRFLDDFGGEELLNLTIHDENTTGLVGEEDDSSNSFGALVKDFGGSEKLDASAGGSYGLGKTVLWAFSGVSTVLFNSVPEAETGGHSPPRLIGRSILPAHDHEGESRTYTNHGWFGYRDEDEIERLGRPPSLWNEDGSVEAVAEKLGIGRPASGPGTSIGVVGFRVPGEDLNPDPSVIAADVRHAAVKHFWPAIAREDLEVYVELPDGTVKEADWDDAPGVEPFARCYGELFDATESELDGPGTVAKTQVGLTVPRENGEVVESPAPEFETTVTLLIRQLSPSDEERLDSEEDTDLTANRVARLRGAQMIVDYVDKSSIADRGSKFVAVLVCGEAESPDGETPSAEQRAVEKFLKRSEPPQHDAWKGSKNDYLKKYYKGTIVSEVAALSGVRLDEKLADVVYEDVESGDEVPGMDDVAPIMEGRATDGEGAGPVLEWERRPKAEFGGSSWRFKGKGGPVDDDHGAWRLTIGLSRLDADESQGDSIEIDSVTPLTGGVTIRNDGDERTLELPASVDLVEFEGESVEVANGTRNVSAAFETGDLTQVLLDVTGTVESGGGD